MQATTIQLVGAALFAVALIHTFSTTVFQRLAHRYHRHEGLLHLLGEVEVVFGFWALVLVLFFFATDGKEAAIAYVDSRNFTEPLFVFAIMVVAGSRPILQLSMLMVQGLARLLPVPRSLAVYFLALSFLPLLGSFITEPAAMTLAAMMLRDRIFATGIPERVKYATLGVLFVNVSIGGTLTPFAAPPVLMVAAKWNWDMAFMLTHFGWRAALAVLVNALAVTMLFRREILAHARPGETDARRIVPVAAMVICTLFLAGVVGFAHHPAVFMGLLLFFIGYSAAYKRHHDPLILREALLVAFFLAGLVVLGGQQQWWLQPVLTSMSPDAVYYGATLLTAITDNAALTYLGSLVEGLSDEFKLSLVAGAVTGGGLTVIANAPNPAGFSILRGGFRDGAINAGWLLLAALGPTLVAVAAFRML
ncbi:putative Na+/H+ antiporter [Aquincola sp. MAHUQ-54]|uniref:Na+/H+ antiporter n=1 Tax=Aquincola agrisoli TaxID=3119538 RepID=A0AAW9QLM9_9BURK